MLTHIVQLMVCNVFEGLNNQKKCQFFNCLISKSFQFTADHILVPVTLKKANDLFSFLHSTECSSSEPHSGGPELKGKTERPLLNWT